MKPIFTIHAGEYIAGSSIEHFFAKNQDYHLWLPTKDKGIDLLISNLKSKKISSIQVKYSKDFSFEGKEVNNRVSSGWFVLKNSKVNNSIADFWVFVVYDIEAFKHNFIVIPKSKLIKLFTELNRNNKTIHCYILITQNGKAFETRGLDKNSLNRIKSETYEDDKRDLSIYLNNWNQLKDALES